MRLNIRWGASAFPSETVSACRASQRLDNNRLIVEGVKIEHRPDENEDGTHDDDCPNDFVDDHDAVVVKLAAHLVNEPCQAVPPQQGAAEDAQVAADHLDGVVGYDKLELCEHGDEQQDDERI